jgi:hypothetical protein
MKILRNIVGEQQKLMSQNAEAALHDCVKNRLYMRGAAAIRKADYKRGDLD